MSTAPNDPAVAVVLPCYAEANALPSVVARVASALEACGESFEILLVDDGSPDDTWQTIGRLRVSDSRIRGVRLSRNFGHQAALLAGLRSARGRAVLTMDADGEHPPELLPEFIAAWRDGVPVVQGIRVGPSGRGLMKGISSRMYYRLLATMSDIPVESGTADFRLLDRRVVDEIVALPGRTVFLRGLVPWLGYPTKFVPYAAGRRVAGRPSYTFARMWRLSLDGILSSSAAPLRGVAGLGVAFASLAFAFLIYVVAVRLFDGRVVPGWASVAGLLTLFGGLQLLALGVLGEYVGRLFTNSLARPDYVVLESLDDSDGEGPDGRPQGDVN